MALSKSRNILRFSLTTLVFSAMFGGICANEYSENIERQDYLQNLQDFGTITRLLRHPQHGQALREFKAVLLREPFLGINKVSGLLSLARLRRYDHNIPGNVYLRDRRSVVGSNETTDRTTYSTMSTYNSTIAPSTNTHQVTEDKDYTTVVSSSRTFVSTSAQPHLTTKSTQLSRCDNQTQRMFSGFMNGEQWALQCKSP